MRTTVTYPTPWQVHSRDDLRLRPATTDDLVPLAALKRRVESRTYAHLGSPEALAIRLHRRCTAWYLLTRIGEGDLVLVAERQGELIGMAAATVQSSFEVRLHSTYVEGTGHGVGKALTRARLEAADRLGITRVVADCFVGVPAAQARLTALGMVERGQRSICPTFPGAALSHWAGSVHTALERATSQPRPPGERMAGLPHHDEAIQIAHVQDDLIREFPTLPADTVRSQVQQVEQVFAGAPVRSFIPVLVGRGARQRLRQLV